jgi:hypothetical protein
MVALGMHSESAPARTLDVELEVQHVGGMLEPAEADTGLFRPTSSSRRFTIRRS